MRSRPNLVFVFADQLRAAALGCYGNQFVPTPNFDAMANSGALFKNAISTWPLCSPARAMLLSGLYPMRNGTPGNDMSMRDDIPTIAKVYKENDYETGYIGKWHLESDREPFVPTHRRMGFDYWAVHNCTHQYMNHFYCRDTPEKIHFKGYDAFVQTDLAVDYITKNKDNPFCLFLSWGPPHDPYNDVPAGYKERIPLNTIVLRENVAEHAVVDHLLERGTLPARTGPVSSPVDWSRWPPVNTWALQDKRKSHRRIVENDERLKKEILHGYYAHTVALDGCIGKIRASLRENEISEDTILVFSSDHGDMLGSHRMIMKQTPFEESLNIPFIVEYPRAVAENTVTEELLAPIDVMPTLISLSGLGCPKVDGKDVSSAVLGEKDNFQDAVLIMKLTTDVGAPYVANAITPWRGVRTRQYTYAHLIGDGPWLLYDNHADPFQMSNLVNDSEYKDLRIQLEKRMRGLMVEAGDSGITNV